MILLIKKFVGIVQVILKKYGVELMRHTLLKKYRMVCANKIVWREYNTTIEWRSRVKLGVIDCLYAISDGMSGSLSK